MPPVTQAAPPLPGLSTAPYGQSLDLNRYCRENYHPSAFAQTTGTHLYNWKCVHNGANLTIDMDNGCRQQHGSLFRAIAFGNHVYDWGCVNWANGDNLVVPVVIIASDYFYDIGAANAGIANAARVLTEVRDWYGEEMFNGKTFTVARPLAHLSLKNKNTWHELSCLRASPSDPDYPSECNSFTGSVDRFGLFDEAIDEISYLFAFAPSSVRIAVPVFVFTGTNSDAFFLGASGQPASTNATSGVSYSVAPPEAAACDSGDTYCATYSVGHELGHGFGLGHTCDFVPQSLSCNESIMETASPPNAILTTREQNQLNTSPLFGN